MARIDVHHHLLTDEYIKELRKVGVQKSGGVAFPRWKPEDSLAVMDDNKIDIAILSLSCPGVFFGDEAKDTVMTHAINEFGAKTVARHSNRFGFFAHLPLPHVDAALKELAVALDILKADGIGLLSNHAGVYLGDMRFDPVMEELNRRGTTVFVHPTVFTGAEIPTAPNAGSPIPTMRGFMLEFVFDTTRAVANMIVSGTQKRFPKIRFILSHAGGTIPFVANKIVSGFMKDIIDGEEGKPSGIAKMLRLKKALEDTERDVFGQLKSLYYDTALSANPQVFSSLLSLIPKSHLLMGSDFPFVPEVGVLSNLGGISGYRGFSGREKKAIFGDSALDLFPRFRG